MRRKHTLFGCEKIGQEAAEYFEKNNVAYFVYDNADMEDGVQQ